MTYLWSIIVFDSWHLIYHFTTDHAWVPKKAWCWFPSINPCLPTTSHQPNYGHLKICHLCIDLKYVILVFRKSLFMNKKLKEFRTGPGSSVPEYSQWHHCHNFALQIYNFHCTVIISSKLMLEWDHKEIHFTLLKEKKVFGKFT